MRTVWIRHPVTKGESEIPASALPHWVGAGWVEFTPEPPAPAFVDSPPADAPTTPPKQRRRRTEPEES